MSDDNEDRWRRSDPPSWAPIPDPTRLTYTLVDREVDHVKELVELQFALIERQRVESKTDTEKALSAALTAQEKAAQVLATFTADQLKALQVSFTTSTDQIRKDIAELKEGAKGREGHDSGAKVEARLEDIARQIDSNTGSLLVGQGAKAGGKEVVAYVIAGLTMLIAIATVLVMYAVRTPR